MLPRETRVDYVKHHVYYALASSDNYSCVYTEGGKLIEDPDENIDVVDGIRYSRDLTRNRELLPFTKPDLPTDYPPPLYCP